MPPPLLQKTSLEPSGETSGSAPRTIARRLCPSLSMLEIIPTPVERAGLRTNTIRLLSADQSGAAAPVVNHLIPMPVAEMVNSCSFEMKTSLRPSGDQATCVGTYC